MRKKPIITAKATVATSKLFAIEQINLTFSNGVERVFERITSNRPAFGAVMIAPITNQNEILLVKEYAVGTDRYELCLPKGLIDEGETPAAAALREMQEEVGFAAHQLDFLTTLSAAPNYFAANLDVFVARNLYPSRLEGDEPEPIEVLTFPLSAIPELLTRDDITEARTIAALFLVKEWLAKHEP